MRVPFSWLCEYVRPRHGIPLEAGDVARRLMMAGISVESIDEAGHDIRGVRVGMVESVTDHPESKTLSVCIVDVGLKRVQLVTGALNVKPDMKVAVALAGATLPRGVQIGVAEFGGIRSEGMMCSAWELGLSDERPDARTGVMVLPQEAPVGADLVEYLSLKDEVLVLDLTPNRADCLSVIGLANEVAALTASELAVPQWTVQNELPLKTEDLVAVEVRDPSLCPRYSARAVREVRVGPSPLWLQRRLHLCGIRSISNVVDVTNYVMLETGQPLHAFDLSLVEGSKVVVRRALPDERILTLDGVERTLSPEMLVIADSQKPIAIAGVIGGANTEVNDGTTRVLIESAHFNGPSVRRTARALGIYSEAALRFEKWVDPNGTVVAMNRASQLMADIGAGKPTSGWIDLYPRPIKDREIRVRPRYVNSVLKTKLTARKMGWFLERLGFEVKGPRGRTGTDEFFVKIPTRRADIVEEVDLIEEIVRLYGYDMIDTRMPNRDGALVQKPPRQRLAAKLRRVMASMGLFEAITRSYLAEKLLDELGIPQSHDWRLAIRLRNPMTEDQALLRRSLIPCLLNALSYNANRGVRDLGLFEIGTVYMPRSLPPVDLPEERLCLAVGLMGKVVRRQWIGDDIPGDFYLLKGMLETGAAELLGSRSGIVLEFDRESNPVLHPGRCAAIRLGTRRIGIMGELDPRLAMRLGLEPPVSLAEVELDPIFEASSDDIRGTVRQFHPVPRYPSARRDIALIVDESVPAAEITKEIVSRGGVLLREVRLFDVYKGKNIPADKRSLAYSLTYRAEDHTLTDEEVDRIHDEVRRALAEKFEAILRS